MNYRIKRSIDISLQNELRKSKLLFNVNANGSLKVFKYQVDTEAKAAFMYLSEPISVPEGELPFSVLSVEGAYGVFTINNRAVILEASSSILESN